MSVPWKPVAIVLAAVVIVGGAILLATQLGSSPSPAAARSPSPRPSGAASPTRPAPTPTLPSVAPTDHPASLEPTPSRGATPARTTPPASSPVATLPAGLVAGAYGFAYPAGWTPGPLVTRNSLVQTETVTDPSGTGRVDYLKESSSAIYNPDHTANDNHIETAIEAALPCDIIVEVIPEPNVGFRYVCSASQGVQITGMVVIAPYAQGARIVQVTIPVAQGDTAVAILNAFH